MDGLTLHTLALGELLTNCYLIYNRENRKGFIVDVPSPLDKVKDFIEKENIDILFVLLTHGHVDHIEGLNSLSYPFYIHPQDAALLKEASLNFSSFLGRNFTVKREPILLQDEAPILFGSYSLEIMHTPGHTPGSVSFKLGRWLFSGDTIFFDSIGRTDIPLASEKVLFSSIKEKILTLPDDTIIYPGHGPSTTVGREKKENIFLIT